MTKFNADDWDPLDGSPGNFVHRGTGEVITGQELNKRDTLAHQEPSGQLARVSDDAIAALFETPPLDIIQWARALGENAAFEDDGDASPELDMVVAILTAQTSDDAFAVTNVKTANDLCGDQPGGHSPLLEITGARPMKSSFKEGPACFTIVDATIVGTGEHIKLSCGGRTVQALILAHMNRGWLPFKAVLVRRTKPTRAGFYPLNLEAGG